MINKKTLWQTLWDYDPNGLVVVNPAMLITVVNPAFCRLFGVEEKDILGYSLSKVLDDTVDFQEAWTLNQIRRAEGKEYPRHQLFVRRLLFPIPDEQVIAGIFVDLTTEWQQQRMLEGLKHQVLEEVDTVIQEQMHAAQEIAQLLGETTARSKINLHKLTALVKGNII
jgi:PAS domain S-box-containing protein